MPNVKRITLDWSETGITVYCIIRRETDGFRLNDADGGFAVNPADPYLSLIEDTVIKGRYEVSESRQVWNDDNYTSSIYKQAGGSPAPASDTIIGTGSLYIISDTDIILNADVSDIKTETESHPTLAEIEASSILAKEASLARILGLVHENLLIDNTTYDSDNNLTAARLRIFPSKADLLVETNVIATYTITAVASGEGKFTTWKQVKD